MVYIKIYPNSPGLPQQQVQTFKTSIRRGLTIGNNAQESSEHDQQLQQLSTVKTKWRPMHFPSASSTPSPHSDWQCPADTGARAKVELSGVQNG